jgi:hypothetical protein
MALYFPLIASSIKKLIFLGQILRLVEFKLHKTRMYVVFKDRFEGLLEIVGKMMKSFGIRFRTREAYILAITNERQVLVSMEVVARGK